MGDLGVVLERPRQAPGDGVTHINLGGIRYLPLVPAAALRRAVREYQEMVGPAPTCEALVHLAEHPSVVLCRGDWERVLGVAAGAMRDPRLSAETRGTFARIRDVLGRAFPTGPQEVLAS